MHPQSTEHPPKAKAPITLEDVLEKLHALAQPMALERAALFGIHPEKMYYGVRIPELRKLAEEIGLDHDLGWELWSVDIHDARILATMVADPDQLTETEMEYWAKDIDTWDVCDQCCMNLFRKTNDVLFKAVEWSSREEVFLKRSAFGLMAMLAQYEQTPGDDQFLQFLPIIEFEAQDSREHVKKAVAWALRQIGKRNDDLHRAAVDLAKTLQHAPIPSARWIADDALYDLLKQD